MIESVNVGELQAALIIRRSYSNSDIEFFTQDEDTLQLGYMTRPKGYKIQPHMHLDVPRTVHYTDEVLLIKKGVVKINFYTLELAYSKSITVYEGDVVLLKNLPHGFDMLADSEILEVKQGPYVGEKDKKKFMCKETNTLNTESVVK